MINKQIEKIRQLYEYPEESIEYLKHRANHIGEVNSLNAIEYISRLEYVIMNYESKIEDSEPIDDIEAMRRLYYHDEQIKKEVADRLKKVMEEKIEYLYRDQPIAKEMFIEQWRLYEAAILNTENNNINDLELDALRHKYLERAKNSSNL